MQRLFFSMAAGFDKQAHGGDSKDAHAHSLGSKIKTHVTMDDAHAKWCKKKHGMEVDQKKSLPVPKALQGSSKSGRLWEEHCNQTLMPEPFNFQGPNPNP